MAARREPGLGQNLKYKFNRALATDRSGNGMSINQQTAWLERSKKWPEMVANAYVPKKLLGAGAYGIVGVWEYRGNPPAQMPKLIAVKQASDSRGPDVATEPLRVESKMMGYVNATNTAHAVKLYKPYHETSGSGSHPEKDPLPVLNAAGVLQPRTKVARIYMEYCRNGTPLDQMELLRERNIDMPEEYIWRVIHCISSALVVLMHGNENSAANGPSWNTPIAHFDIKPENSESRSLAKIQYRSQESVHLLIPISFHR